VTAHIKKKNCLHNSKLRSHFIYKIDKIDCQTKGKLRENLRYLVSESQIKNNISKIETIQ